MLKAPKMKTNPRPLKKEDDPLTLKNPEDQSSIVLADAVDDTQNLQEILDQQPELFKSLMDSSDPLSKNKNEELKDKL